MDVVALVEVIQHFRCKVRLKHLQDEIPEAWAMGAIMPVPGYIELHGPWPIREVEWLEIDPITTVYIGRLVASRQTNNTEQLKVKLQEAGLPYTVTDEIFRILFSELNK